MNKSFSVVFGGLLALALLLLYAISAWSMIIAIIVACPEASTCNGEIAAKYKDGFRYVLTTVGGLVSALVIARLSISPPGQMPNFEPVKQLSKGLQTASFILVSLYLTVWAITGLAALIVGVMLYPNIIPTVSDLGTVWLGLAVAAGYAYFGLTPPDSSESSLISPSSLKASTETIDALKKHIEKEKIKFDKPSLEKELLGENDGEKVTPKLQKPVLHLADTVGSHIRISSLVRGSGHHGKGRAVDIGNEDIADDILPEILPLVESLSIDEIIFDAAVASKPNRNEWNHDRGNKHDYDVATLNKHKDHIHLSVLN